MIVARNIHMSGLGFDWDVFNKLVTTGTGFASNVLTLRPPPGTTIQTGPQGTVVQRTSTGLAPGVLGFPGAGGIGLGTILLLGGGALLLITLAKGRG
jgi:hypothetical protein